MRLQVTPPAISPTKVVSGTPGKQRPQETTAPGETEISGNQRPLRIRDPRETETKQRPQGNPETQGPQRNTHTTETPEKSRETETTETQGAKRNRDQQVIASLTRRKQERSRTMVHSVAPRTRPSQSMVPLHQGVESSDLDLWYDKPDSPDDIVNIQREMNDEPPRSNEDIQYPMDDERAGCISVADSLAAVMKDLTDENEKFSAAAGETEEANSAAREDSAARQEVALYRRCVVEAEESA
ncbi:hypothetical protein BDD12DRAFT_904645 [Trichophaea hybrida]|nr:hypothetical protein BDD12DRAFT_904645 [Trichophaea hybrida]